MFWELWSMMHLNLIGFQQHVAFPDTFQGSVLDVTSCSGLCPVNDEPPRTDHVLFSSNITLILSTIRSHHVTPQPPTAQCSDMTVVLLESPPCCGGGACAPE